MMRKGIEKPPPKEGIPCQVMESSRWGFRVMRIPVVHTGFVFILKIQEKQKCCQKQSYHIKYCLRRNKFFGPIFGWWNGTTTPNSSLPSWVTKGLGLGGPSEGRGLGGKKWREWKQMTIISRYLLYSVHFFLVNRKMLSYQLDRLIILMRHTTSLLLLELCQSRQHIKYVQNPFSRTKLRHEKCFRWILNETASAPWGQSQTSWNVCQESYLPWDFITADSLLCIFDNVWSFE